MTYSTIAPRTQIMVLCTLLVLTALTIAISFLQIPGRWHLAAGVGIAVVKSTLVGLFFMHLIHSKAAARAVIVTVLFWLVAVFIGLTFTDYAMRGNVPFAPGH